MAKTTKPSAPPTGRAGSTVFGQLVFIDIHGPVYLESVSGYRYVIAVVDDYSRFTVLYYMTRRSEAVKKLQQYCNWVSGLWASPAGVKYETETGKRFAVHELSVRSLQTDNAGELTSDAWYTYCASKNIKCRNSSADSRLT